MPKNAIAHILWENANMSPTFGLMLIFTFVSFNYSFSQNNFKKSCEDYYLGIDVPNSKQPIFLDAYAELSNAQESKEKVDFDRYMLALEMDLDTLKSLGCWEGYSRALQTLGASYLSMGAYMNEFEKAKDYLDEIFTLDSLKLHSSHPIRTSSAYYLAQFYERTYQADSAIKFFKICLQHYGGNIANKGLNISLIHFGLAQVYLELKHNIVKAEEHFEKFLETRRHPEYDTSKDLSGYHNIYKLEGYHNFAKKYFIIGDYDKALSYTYRFKDSLSIHPFNIEIRKIYASKLLGEIHFKKGEIEFAYENFLQAKEYLKKSPNYYKSSSLDYFFISLGISKIHTENNSFKDAKSSLIEGMKILTKENNPDNKFHAALGLQQLAYIEFLSNQYENSMKSIDSCDQLLDQFEIVSADLKSKNLILRSKILEKRGDLKKALTLISKAEKMLTDNYFEEYNPYKNILLKVYSRKANLLCQLAQYGSLDQNMQKEAIEYYFNASTILKDYLYELERENSLLELKQSSYELFENALACIWSNYQHNPTETLAQKAFLLMERSKGSALDRKLVEKYNNRLLPNIDEKNNRNLQKELAFHQAQLTKLDPAEDFYEREYRQISQRILELEEKLNHITKPSKKLYSYANAGIVDFTQMLNNITKSDYENILSFYWGKKSLYRIFYNSDKGFTFYRTDNIEALKTEILRLRNVFLSYKPNKDARVLQNSYIDFTESAYSLYKSLFENIELNRAKEKSGILILSDGPLGVIPLEVLLTQKPPKQFSGYNDLSYLVRDFNLHYAPSFSFLMNENLIKTKSQKSEILAFSYSGEKANFNKVYASIKRGGKLEDLPGSYAELQSISKYYDGSYHIGNEATKSQFFKQAGNYSALHLSLHGGWDSLDFPYLVFPTNDASTDVDFLYSYELAGSGLKANLAVLSACESGLGSYISGEGMQSIANSFLGAGCSSVIFSLWKVDDKSTSDLMEFLYHNLSQDKEMNDALSQAKRDFLKNTDPYISHPANWSSFILYGQKKPLNQNSWMYQLPLFLLIFISTLTLILGMLYLQKQKKISTANSRSLSNPFELL
ncbi:MAG: CHAT domain-containing protein [Bacteroidia bacterium]|nr:CHAT domain-containing protein [Bacteroidia bacterium]